MASDLERLDRQNRELRVRLAGVAAENSRLRMDLIDWQEQAEIRSLGVQMASEQRDQAFDENDSLRARLAEVEAERDRLRADLDELGIDRDFWRFRAVEAIRSGEGDR